MRPSSWCESRYTGLFTAFGGLDARPHDPDVAMWAGSLAPAGARREILHIGGAGLDPEQARLACLGEAIERYQTAPLPRDGFVDASFEELPLHEAAVEPERWVLFLPEQYASPDFPFRPFRRATRVRWQPLREVPSGRAVWVPEDLAHLHPRPSGRHSIAAMTSTGLSAGTDPDRTLLRGVQEVIERDGVLGAWWGRYPLEERPAQAVFAAFGAELRSRLERPNLEYRFYRVRSPFSDHLTITTLAGEDREGPVFSVGSACRETPRASFLKSAIEAVQGRHYVRWVLGREQQAPNDSCPESFAEHALYYTLRPRELGRTVLARAPLVSGHDLDAVDEEGLPALLSRLGSEHPVLFRIATPPVVLGAPEAFLVLKVLIVGLQPLHGDHRLAHLGGPLWAPRGFSDWADMPPHPFA